MAQANRTPAARKGAIYEMHTGAYEVEWPTAGKRTYNGISVAMRREGSTLPSERITVYADSTDAELTNARETLAQAHNAVVAEIKRRAEAPKDPRDVKLTEMEKLMAEATATINALKAQIEATPKASTRATAKAQTSAPVTVTPATPTTNGVDKTGEQELADLPF